MEEDDMVKSRYGNTLSTERDEPMRRERAVGLRSL